MRIPVVDENEKPLMPTTPSRARRWIKSGKAKGCWSKLGVFYVKLTQPPSDYKKQDIVVGVDPGKLYTGVAIQSSKFTLLMLHLELPFKTVKGRMETRSMMSRNRRGRRINRKQSFKVRAHRQKRFNNRRRKGIPPSIQANKRMELRVIQLLIDIYPISHVVVERVMAKGDKGFSPVMVGQLWQLEELKQAQKFLGFKVSTQEGWETSRLRKHIGLPKDKEDKSRQIPATHAVDGIALATSRWMQYDITSLNSMGWKGHITVTPSQFIVVKRPPVSRRQLHLMLPTKGGVRRKYGGTTTRHGFRKGDYVEATQGNKTYRGWVSGDTKTQISVSDANWQRLGRFSPKKILLLQRSTGLLVSTDKKLHFAGASNPNKMP